MWGKEYKRGEGCAVLYVHVSTMNRVAVATANVSSVKAISTAASIQRAFYVLHVCTLMYEALVCMLQLCGARLHAYVDHVRMHFSSVTLPNTLDCSDVCSYCTSGAHKHVQTFQILLGCIQRRGVEGQRQGEVAGEAAAPCWFVRAFTLLCL